MNEKDRQAVRIVNAATAANRRATVSHLARTLQGWGQTYRTTRLRCGKCDDGYMVYGRRFGAFCSEAAHGCGFSMRRPEYLTYKGMAVQEILIGYDFPGDVWPYFRVVDQRKSRTSPETRPPKRVPTIARVADL